LGNARADCVNNFCRFEVCIDYSAIGEGRARHRMTRISPAGGQQVTVFKPVGKALRPNGIDMSQLPTGWSLFGQALDNGSGGNYITYNTHIMYGHVRPENRNFWIGPACEVEGGCGGAPPPPPAAVPESPSGLIAR
jgi:hypothetical protein